MKQGGEKRPVGRGEPGFVDLALQDGELVAQRQDLDIFVGVSHRQEPEKPDHAGRTREDSRPSTADDPRVPLSCGPRWGGTVQVTAHG